MSSLISDDNYSELSEESYRIYGGFLPFRLYMFPKYAKDFMHRIGAPSSAVLNLFSPNIDETWRFIGLMDIERSKNKKEFDYIVVPKKLRFQNPYTMIRQKPFINNRMIYAHEKLPLSYTTRVYPNKSLIFDYSNIYKRVFLRESSLIADIKQIEQKNYIKKQLYQNRYQMCHFMWEYLYHGMEGFIGEKPYMIDNGTKKEVLQIQGFNPLAVRDDIIIPIYMGGNTIDTSTLPILYQYFYSARHIPLEKMRNLAFFLPLLCFPAIFQTPERYFGADSDVCILNDILEMKTKFIELFRKYADKQILFFMYNDDNFFYFRPKELMMDAKKFKNRYYPLMRASYYKFLGNSEEYKEKDEKSKETEQKKQTMLKFSEYAIKNAIPSRTAQSFVDRSLAVSLKDDDVEDELPELPEEVATNKEKEEIEDTINIDTFEPGEEELEEVVNHANTGTISGFNPKNKLSKKQIQNWENTKEKYKSIIDPVSGKNLDEVMNHVESLTIDENIVDLPVSDKGFQQDRIRDYHNSYYKKRYHQDIYRVFISAFANENNPLPMTLSNYEINDVSDALSNMENHRATLKDMNGKLHYINIDLPKIEADGTMYINGSRKYLKHQLSMLPVAKIGPQKVMMNSTLNKAIISSSGKYVNNNTPNILKFIEYLEKRKLIKTKSGKAINTSIKSTLDYDILSKHYFSLSFKSLTHKGNDVEIYFSQDDVNAFLKESAAVKYREIKKKRSVDPTLCVLANEYVRNDGGKIIKLTTYTDGDSDKFGVCDLIWTLFFEHGYGKYIRGDEDKSNPNTKDNDALFSFSPTLTRPMYSQIVYLSRKFPLIAFLGPAYGLSQILKVMERVYDTKYLLTHKRKSSEDELSYNFVRFKDCYLYYPKASTKACMLLNGLHYMKTEEYNFEEFDNINTYADYTERRHGSRHLVKGLQTYSLLFIDPLTKNTLIAMELPTDFLELVLYANSLMDDFDYFDENDLRLYRLRLLEVVPSLLYKNLARQYDVMTQNTTVRSMSLPKNAIMAALNNSLMIELSDGISPVAQSRASASVTWKGPGGINAEHSYTKAMRSFHKGFRGNIAISTVDSLKVGINRTMTGNPGIVNNLGMFKIYTEEELENASISNLQSKPESMVANIFCNDPKRIAFTENQSSHEIPTNGMMLPLFYTAAALNIARFAGKDFCVRSKVDGKVVEINSVEKYIIVEENKTRKRFMHDYSKSIVKNEYFGSDMDINPCVKNMQKVKNDEILAQSNLYFRKNLLGDNCTLQGAIVRVAILEGVHTEEDSSAISEQYSKKASVDVIYTQRIAINMNSRIFKIAKIGDHIHKREALIVSSTYDDPLLSYEQLGEDFLRDISAARHRSNFTGEVIDTFAYCSKELTDDVSDSVRKTVNAVQLPLKRKIKNLEKSGVILEDDLKHKLKPIRLELQSDSIFGFKDYDETGIVVFEFLIKHQLNEGITDKQTIDSSLKTIIQDVIPEENTIYAIDENTGKKRYRIDGIMSFLSGANRLVSSHLLNGVGSKINRERSKQIWTEYFAK